MADELREAAPVGGRYLEAALAEEIADGGVERAGDGDERADGRIAGGALAPAAVALPVGDVLVVILEDSRHRRRDPRRAVGVQPVVLLAAAIDRFRQRLDVVASARHAETVLFLSVPCDVSCANRLSS